MTFALHRLPLATRRQFCTGTLGVVATGTMWSKGQAAEAPSGLVTLTQPPVQQAGQFDRPWGVLAVTPDTVAAPALLDHGWHTGKRRLRCRWKGSRAALWVSIPAGVTPDEVLLAAVNNSNVTLRLHCTVVWRLRTAPFPDSDSSGWAPVPPGVETPLRFRIATDALPQMDGVLLFLESEGDGGDVLLSGLETHTAARSLGTVRVSGAIRAGHPITVHVTSAVSEPLCLEVRRGDTAIWAHLLPDCPPSQTVSHRIELPSELTAGPCLIGLTAAGRRNLSGDLSVRIEAGSTGRLQTAVPGCLCVLRSDLALTQSTDVSALLDQLESEALSQHASHSGLQLRVMLRPPLWWILANRRDMAMHADGWVFVPALDADGFPMASLASDAWRALSISMMQALVQGVMKRAWGWRVSDICLDLPAPPSHRRAADYSAGASARLAGWLAETRRMAPSRANLVPLPERLDPPGLGVYTADERDVHAHSWRLFHETLSIEYVKLVVGGLPAVSSATVTVGVPEWPSLWYPYPGRWFDSGIKRVERRSADLLTGGDALRHPWPVQVVLVCDEASMRLAPPGSPYGYAGALHMGQTLNRIGAPWMVKTADQLASMGDDVKLLIVFGMIAPDPATRRTLQQLIRQGGRHIVVIGPTGLVDPATQEWRRSGPRMLLSLPLEFDAAPGPIGLDAGLADPMWPRLIGDDSGGPLYADRMPATSHRDLPGGRLTWCGSPYLGSGILRNWGTAAGIHLYAPDGVSIGFSESRLSVLSRDTSEVLLHLPAPRTLHDPLDGWTAAGSHIVCPVTPNRLRRLEVLEA